MLRPKGTFINGVAKIGTGCHSELALADLYGNPNIAEPLVAQVQVAHKILPCGATNDQVIQISEIRRNPWKFCTNSAKLLCS